MSDEMPPTLREMINRLPPPTDEDLKWQRLSFAYGNLACTTNHRPVRAAFKTVALNNGWTDEEFEVWARGKQWR